MSPRDSVVAWRDTDAWTDSSRDGFNLKPLGAQRLTTGYYLLVPVVSEKAGLDLAKKLASQDSISPSRGDE